MQASSFLHDGLELVQDSFVRSRLVQAGVAYIECPSQTLSVRRRRPSVFVTDLECPSQTFSVCRRRP